MKIELLVKVKRLENELIPYGAAIVGNRPRLSPLCSGVWASAAH
jgi:hypothetical protein